MRPRGFLAVLVTLSLFMTSCGGGSADVATADTVDTANTAPSTESASDETPAPAASAASLIATTISGEQINFGSLEGQDVVLWFWAPW